RVLGDFALDAAQTFATLEPGDGSRMRERAVRDFWRRHVLSGDPAEAAWVLGWLDSPATLGKWLEEALRLPPERNVPDPDAASLEAARARVEAHRATAPRDALAREARRIVASPALSRAAKSPYQPATFARLTGELEAWLAGTQADAPLAALRAFTLACVAQFRHKARAQGWTIDETEVCAWAQDALADALAYAYARRNAFLQRALAEVRSSIARQKLEERVIAFDDLIADLRAVVARSPEVVAAIRARYTVALVDEFQDTDADQYAIFRALFHGREDGALYLIGDPKQAIYRFRGGDVFAYRAAARDADARWTLDANWRSDARLIEAVNALFDPRRVPAPFVHDFIDFRPAGYGLPRPARARALDPVDAPLVAWTLQDAEPPTKAELSPRIHAAVAAEIERLLAAQPPERPLTIAVLVRDRWDLAGAVRALSRRGIASSHTSTERVYDGPEALELATVLAALAEPSDLRRARAALATDLVGYDDAALRATREDDAALDSGLMLLAALRETAAAHGPAALARRLGQHAGPRWLARYDGRRRMTNLAHLGEALQREAAALPGLSAQLAWLERRIAGGGESPDAELRPESSGAAVEVLTVHKSKGLEWDVVFAPFLWSGKQEGHEEDPLKLERRLPVGYHGEADGLHVDLGSPEWDARMAQKQGECAAEAVRLVYVALTRARHRAYTFWGHARTADCSAFVHLLHQQVHLDAAGAGSMLAQWREFAHGAVRIETLPDPGDVALAHAHAQAAATPPPIARAFAGTIDRRFRVLSYSALFGESDEPRPDHDAAVPAPLVVAPGPVPSNPRGAEFGECVHAILEHYAFADPDGAANDRLVEERCRDFGYDAGETAFVRTLVRETARAHVVEGVPLAALDVRRMEMEFFFPLDDARLDDVAAALALDPRYARDEAEFAALRPRMLGLMHGYVDLVFAHGGRYGLVDYKTNFLGSRHEDYAAAALAHAVRASDYDLQYLIYTVALVRQLRARLGARFDYARDYAGVAYLFVRGLAGGHGVHRDVPPRAVVDALDRAFGGER
ncbi:MAG TPA: UvrD-helicase domain-containing protein, partial [Xanthomonadales bacterium]|nr:UvrD-helicase domain-containing protein [Xanthomonadales bacterium]